MTKCKYCIASERPLSVELRKCRYISNMHGGKCIFQLGSICLVLAVILHPINTLPASEQDKERVKSKMLVVKWSAGWQEVLWPHSYGCHRGVTRSWVGWLPIKQKGTGHHRNSAVTLSCRAKQDTQRHRLPKQGCLYSSSSQLSSGMVQCS